MKRNKCFLNLSSFGFLFLVFNYQVFAQTQENQTSRPAFLQTDEKVDRIINDKIYDVINNADVVGATEKLYFTDGLGNVLNTFKMFPSSTVLAANGFIRYTKKYLSILRSYRDGEKNILDGFILDGVGKVLWHISQKNTMFYMFPDDKNNSVMMINNPKGYLKVYDVNGVEKAEKYFTDQNDQKYSDLAAGSSEDVDFRDSIVSSVDGDYIAVYRASTDFQDFQSELTLLDPNGNIIFQNRAPQSKVGLPLKIFENLKIIVIQGDINGQPTGPHHRSQDTYFGIDFTGKELWEMDGEKYWIDPNDLRDLKGTVVKIENQDNQLGKNGRQVINSYISPSNLTVDIKTGEIK